MKDDQSSALYGTEHYLAWLMAVIAIALGTLGALVAFDVLTFRDVSTDDLGAVTEGSGAAAQNFQDGMLLILPAIAAAFLAMTLHNTEHHRTGIRESALWTGEHSLAYLGALATIALGVLAIVVGFNVFDDGNSWRDGAVWGALAITSGVLTATLHAVQHHAFVESETEIKHLVDERVEEVIERSGVRPPSRTVPGH